MLKEDITRLIKIAFERFIQSVKWSITYDDIFEKVETAELAMPHSTFHDEATPFLVKDEIEEKISNAFMKRDIGIENFVHNGSG